MKLEIFDEKKIEKVLRLKLGYSSLGICLFGIDENGDDIADGVILTIQSNGTLYRNNGCCVEGIQINDNQEIIDSTNL